MNPQELDAQVRSQAFKFLDDQIQFRGDKLPRKVLEKGFEFRGQRVPLVGPQGIFKPAVLPDIPISITTVPLVEGKRRPYEDTVGDDGLITYKYRGTDPAHPDNAGLRLAMQYQTPLIYFFGLVPGIYVATYPVFVVGDNPGDLCFKVAVDDRRALTLPSQPSDETETRLRRMYVTTLTQRRLHQQSFRERVLRAYRECCAVCRLRYAELLDAAHILPDTHPKGEPFVHNGLALCKLHHAAFDNNILGIRPDLIVEISARVRKEQDGPMLVHGLQQCHGQRLLVVPSSESLRPNPAFLEERYEMFRKTI